MENQHNQQDNANNPTLQERPVSPSSASDHEDKGGNDSVSEKTRTSRRSQLDEQEDNATNNSETANDERNQRTSNEMYQYANVPQRQPEFEHQPGMAYPMNMPLPYFPHPFQEPNSLPFPNFLPSLYPNLPQSNNLNVTRQFYEQQMREHAMQYANAAAGAAWAAARIANGDHQYPMMGGPPSHYVAASSVGIPNGWVDQNAVEATAAESYTRRRSLWKPPTSNNSNSIVRKNKSKIEPSDNERKKPSKLSTNVDTKRSKKRESGGNDSVSSLGSGCTHRDRDTQSNSKQPRHNKRNQRQKRGLYQSYSPRGSSSSLGTLGSNPQNYRGHKRRNTSLTSPRGNSVFNISLGGLIGKSGVSALHELCSKYRWEMPKYELIEPSKDVSEGDNTKETKAVNAKSHYSYTSHNQDFVFSVRVNDVELGRGRGGTKASSKQDGSRKALAALVPGVVFDPNGILLDIGSGVLKIIDENSRSAPTSLEELAPHLAVQLAIGESSNQGVAAAQQMRPSSPDISEDSSISTTVSMTKSKPEHVILGGLLQSSSVGGIGSSANIGIFPSVSSASEVDDDDQNIYHLSGEARVCSILLHAMWQIDYRIREPPSYHLSQSSNVLAGKKDESQTHIEIAAHRLPFECTASLKLYFPKSLVDGKDPSNIMEHWESPLEHLESKPSSISQQVQSHAANELSRKRKDSLPSQAATSPEQKLHHRDRNSGEHLGSSVTKMSTIEQEDTVPHRIEGTATGSTKRESKHRASAKLLAMLFPECSSLVEVIAAAEAARERYAAKKTLSQTKRAKLCNEQAPKSTSSHEAAAFSTSTEKGETFSRDYAEITDSEKLSPDELKFKEKAEADVLSESLFSVAGLSLSEPPNNVIDNEALHHKIDSAINSLISRKNENASDLKIKRVTDGDLESVRDFLNKHQLHKSSESIGLSKVEKLENPKSLDYEENAVSFNKQSGPSIILLFSRLDARYDNPPLGLAMLTLSAKKRTLSLHALWYEESVEKDLFMEYLDELAKIMHYDLDEKFIVHDIAIKFIVQNHLYERKTSIGCKCNEPLSSYLLQSVKEEDEEAGGSEEDEGNENDLSGRKRSRVN